MMVADMVAVGAAACAVPVWAVVLWRITKGR
jgi:hypothetical protein